MCSENKPKTISTAFWERAVKTCGKPHPLLSKTAVTTSGNPSSAYKLSLDSTRKIASTDFWKRAVATCEKSQPLLTKCALAAQGKLHPLVFECGQWQHEENHIHCLVKQQWEHMEIHPLLKNCAVTAQGKLHQLIFKREQWQHAENHIHYFVHYSDNMENHPLLIKGVVIFNAGY